MALWFFVGILNFVGWWMILRNNMMMNFLFGSSESLPMSFVIAAWIVGFMPHLQYFMMICLGCFFLIGIIAHIGSRYSDIFTMTLSEFEKRIFENERFTK